MYSKWKCPLCNRALPPFRSETAVSVMLENALRERFPLLYTARELEEAEAGTAEGESVPLGTNIATLPVFVLDSMLPRQTLHLNVFEPRYLLMTERVLQGDRKFGMVGWGGSPHRGHRRVPVGFGVEVEITDVDRCASGSYRVTVVGRRPFKILDNWAEDGYMVANVEYLALDVSSRGNDTALATTEAASATSGSDVSEAGEDGNVSAAGVPSADEISSAVDTWLELVRAGGWERQHGHIDAILEGLGPMPPVTRSDDLAFWIAALVNPIPGLGVSPEIRLETLEADSSASRIAVALGGLYASTAYLEPGFIAKGLSKLGIPAPQPLMRSLTALLPWAVVLGAAVIQANWDPDNANGTKESVAAADAGHFAVGLL